MPGPSPRLALALGCAIAVPAHAEPRPALGAGGSVVVIEERAFGARTSLGASFAGEVALPIRGTRWSLVPSLTLGVRVGTQPVVGTLAETFALARGIGRVSIRFGVGPVQMLLEDSGRARFVERGVGAYAAVHYHPRRNLAVVVSLGQGWLGEVTVTSSTVGAAWTP